MNCDKYLDLISARLDGQLTVQEDADLTAHLQTCPACRAIAKDMEGLHSALSSVGEVDAPPELSQTVLSKIRAEKRPNRRRTLRQLSALAACLVLCVGVLRVTDAAYSDYRRAKSTAGDPELPSVARHMEPQPVALNRLDAYSLPTPADTTVDPFAHLLDSVDALNRFLARLPQTDFSTITNTYDEDFFRANRLVAMVLDEPSTSITHRVTELTKDRVVVLRDVPETGDCARALWLILGPTELVGPERSLALEIINESYPFNGTR